MAGSERTSLNAGLCGAGRLGYTAGTGIELALNDSVTLKAEYPYTGLGSHQRFVGQACSSTAHSTSSTVRVGVNFKLN